MIRSVRGRVLLGTGAAVVMVLALAGALLDDLVRGELRDQFDDTLAARARGLALLVQQRGGALDSDLDQVSDDATAGAPVYFELWDQSGRAVARSPALGRHDLAPSPLGPGDRRVAAVALPGGVRGRQLTWRFRPVRDDEESADERAVPALWPTLAVARPTAELEAGTTRLRTLLVLTGLAAATACLALLAWIGRVALRPIDQVVARIEQLGEHDLAGRIDPGAAPRELTAVVDRLNRLLDRVQRAFERERRLGADVAHELRTPLAGLTTTLEVALARERAPARYREAMETCLDICHQTRRMVEALLSLARIDAALARSVRRERLDLAELVDRCLSLVSARVAARGLHLGRDIAAPLWISSDAEPLRVVITNLMDNAVSHADEGGRIAVTGRRDGDRVLLEVRNSGSRVSHEQAQRAFERFWRGDRARAAGEHAGLGLALCHRLIELLGGDIAASSTAGGDFLVAVRLPAGD